MNDQPETDEKGMILNRPDAPDYSGMATEPFSDEARRVLAECPKHEDVEVKPDGICYMPGVWYRRQLTRAFGAGAWALKPTAPPRTVGNTVEWYGALYILGRWVAEATGGQATSDWMNHADAIQGAKTDCLSKCCGHGLAMASELWDKTWREAWMSEYTVKEWKDGKDGKKGKWVFRLKEARAPRAADLMGAPSSGTAQALASSAPDATPTPTSATAASASPASEMEAHELGFPVVDTGEAAPEETYRAIQAEMKRLHFKAPIAKSFLSKYGVDKVSALTAVQAAEALAVLLKEAS